MRGSESPPRIALVFDDELEHRRFVDHLGPGARLFHVPGGVELVKLAAERPLDVVVVGVLNRNDDFLPVALRALRERQPEVTLIGVFEASAPSLDEAGELAREVPGMVFVRRPGGRFNYLARRRRPGRPPPTLTPALLECMDRLPLFGPAHRFALLQALHPSCAASIPEQARELGLSRRNLERWFQGPDLCSAGCFQSVCGAAEAAYLRLMLELPARDVAPAVGILTREGVENPQAVPRTIRNVLRSNLEDLRAAGVAGLMATVEATLRAAREPVKTPALWEAETRFMPAMEVVLVPMDGDLSLMLPASDVRFPLDAFGADAWSLLTRGSTFAYLVAELAAVRGQPVSVVRHRLIEWLGELLVLRMIRRERGGLRAANGD